MFGYLLYCSLASIFSIYLLLSLFLLPLLPLLLLLLLRFNQNFGVLGILDRLHNTDEGFRHSKAYERHILLLGLSPAKELIPDPPKGKERTCSPVPCQ